ncbi:MAG: HAMP domain-containing protein [Nitrospirae bacterium]|nr:HAMP domain-containing protein [Nitrospirota bacterium]MBI3353138.1 HAMP domain-containing protein [Nitrospirota bacterium]
MVRFGLQAKVVFITVLTGVLVGGLLVSFEIYENMLKTVEIAKDRLQRDGVILQQQITEHGEKALELSKNIAILLRVSEPLNQATIQGIISSFQKKNPGFRISVTSPEGIFSADLIHKGKSADIEELSSVFSALKGEAAVSIEKTSSEELSIAASAPMILKTSGLWIVHAEWPLSQAFSFQLRKLIDKDVFISFFPLTKGKSISNLIQEKIIISPLEAILPYKKSTLQNPFFSKAEKETPSFLTYYIPLINSLGMTLGAIQFQLEKSVIFSNKGFFQYGAFILLFPLSIGTLVFVLVKYMITKPVIHLSKVARTIAEGNFNAPIPLQTSKDEIGELSSALSEMRRKIERKTTELTSLNDTLFTQKGDLITLNEELHRKNDYIESLVNTVSHELRTPMASIMGFSELLLNRKLPDDKQKKYLETIFLESKRLASILTEFLDIQKMESSDPGLVQEVLFLPEIIDRVLERFSTAIYSKHQFVKILPPFVPPVKGDKKRLFQCFMNLLSNAVKYSPQGGEVKIEITTKEKEVIAAVQDQGLGIPKEMLGKLFTKFFRVDSSDHRDIGGTGLGLALCKDIIELHGGQIRVESTEGKGSRFIVSLPFQKTAVTENQGKN